MEQNERSSLVKEFQDWILKQKVDGYELNSQDSRKYTMESPYGLAEIGFYDQDIIEIIVRMKADNSVKYYLHFQLKDLSYAKTLYQEMIDAFQDLKFHEKTRVLLCCTSGATTGFFANLLNQAAESMGLDMTFDATSYYFLYEKAPLYDVILTAPQINYKFKKIEASLPKKLVMQIPTRIFAQNDAFKMLKVLEEQVEKLKKAKGEYHEDYSDQQRHLKTKQLIIVAGSIYGSVHYRTYGRVYDGEKLILEDEQIKPVKYGINIRDMIDILYARVEAAQTDPNEKVQIKMICLALPGIVNNGIWSLSQNGINNLRLQKQLEDRYQTKVILNNSSNASALGFAHLNPQYSSVVFHSQPYAVKTGGQGSVVFGKVILGHNGLAGEIQYFADRLQYSHKRDILCKTESGMLELVVQYLIPAISIIDPEVIALRSPMTSDMEEVRSRLAAYIPERDIPELVYIPDMEKYMLEGCLRFALQELDKKEHHERKERH